MIGTRLGPYELVAEIGHGGMATVYRAYQPSMERQVAVKVINHTLAEDAVGYERFQREARLIARLEHLHILPVYDYNSSHQPPYIVMRYLAGGTLKSVLQKFKGRALHPTQTTRWLGQIAAALDYAHRHQVIHRDLKPSNIMVDSEGDVFLTDFGVARLLGSPADLTNTGAAMGTPAYMAPEQAIGADNVGPRADLYSLGVIAFEMLTGTPPYEAESAMALALRHLQAPIPLVTTAAPQWPPAINAVFQRILAKDPADRYPTAQDFVQALLAVLNLADGTYTATLATPLADLTPHTPAPPRRASPLTDTRTPTEQNKQIIVLHASLAEFEESLYNTLEAEVVPQKLKEIGAQLDRAVAESGGTVLKRTGNEWVLAWGATATREDDPERSVRTALALRESAQPWAENPTTSPLQIGLTLGVALLTQQSAGDYTASGPPLLQASRLLATLPDGGIVITQELYRLVRGGFAVEPLPALRLRGQPTPLEIYQVLRAKPRLSRLTARDFEGETTRLIGREAELLQLQKAFEAVLEDGEAQLLTVSGDTGVGKTRLLFEFDQWREKRGEVIRAFNGRATPETTRQPYALLRDLFSTRFDVADHDSPATVQEKFERGFQLLLGPTASLAGAHLIGQLVGFDFAASPHLRGVVGNAAQLHELAVRQLAQFFRAAARTAPTQMVLLLCEGLQWADDKSLEVLNWLVRENHDTPLLMMGAARPSLFARPVNWGAKTPGFLRVELAPLPKREARRLVRELLQKVPQLPEALRDLIVERAEGNPLYIEEVVKTLLEDRIVVPGPTATDPWRVELGRLAQVRVPPTLTGILQARLDSLTPDERTILQRAAAIGRIFWDGAVQALETGDEIPLPCQALLAQLCQRELIYPRENAALAGTREYIFAGQLLRDVAYESTLKRVQRGYHAALGHWLVGAAGARVSEYTALIAENFERANLPEAAAAWLQRAGEQAYAISAYAEARTAFERALQLLPANATPARAVLLIRLANTFEALGQYPEAYAPLEEALGLAQSLHDTRTAAEVLSSQCWLLYRQSEFAAAIRVGQQALPLAREVQDQTVEAWTLWRIGVAFYYQEDYAAALESFHASLALFQGLGHQEGVARCYNTLGEVARFQKRYAEAADFYQSALGLARQLGNRERIAAYLGNLGENARYQGDYVAAERYYLESRAVCEEIGALNLVAWHHINLGHVAVAQHQLPQAAQFYRAGIQVADSVGVKTLVLDGLVGVATWLAQQNAYDRAAALLAVALAHPALGPEGRSDADIPLALLRAALPAAELEAVLQAPPATDLAALTAEILQMLAAAQNS